MILPVYVVHREMQFLIYGIVDPDSGLYGYVGASKRGLSRPRANWEPGVLANESNAEKKAWLSAILTRGLPRVDVLEDVGSDDLLPEAEKRWIAKLRAEGHPLTNRSPGGDGSRYYVPSPETCERIAASKRGVPRPDWARAKMSASHLARERTPEELEHARQLGLAWKGKKRSAETRAKMSAAKLGKKRDPETIAKMSASAKGRVMSPETRAKISAAKKGKLKSEETKARMAEATRRRWAERKAAAIVAEPSE